MEKKTELERYNRDSNLTNTPRIETKRLILRRFTAEDLKPLFIIYSDEKANTYLPWFPLKNPEEAEVLLKEKYLEPYLQPQGYRYAICLKHDNGPIGYVHLGMEEGYDFGYGLRTEFWHRGIVTEAARAVIGQLKRGNIPYITATHDVKNIRSGNVMRQLGMSYQYTYEEQWQPKNLLVTFRMYQLNLTEGHQNTYMKYWNTSEVHFVETGL